MTHLLHIDASARPGRSGSEPYGSHTRRLSHRFVTRWMAARPHDRCSYRDVGVAPPTPVSAAWVHAAFTPQAQREDWMQQVLAESDALVDELLQADLLVLGVPMYNFGPPAPFKAYIDNIVRVGRTFGFDRSRPGLPYWPMLKGQGKRIVLLSSRGDFGYEAGGHMAGMNHVEGSIASAFKYLGVDEFHSAAIEYDEFADERLAQSIAAAEQRVDVLVDMLQVATPG
ncbi:FMN-dependent NADH-azoreductase [Paucibacter oligotrophus]|uniref:FMN dependent NADH:quinone oxidoreductase n=1 Tax=Roseateles oligotrophus TaxID=1769250 RepID=A0A840LJA8_9BURK|nr:NAD(P)H-dependent oxidoreductase [Roseateles oligotrophus]MBB4845357.1 FMN-dependent NADH-azoreductase [Roseateles oligotrophus]